MCFSMLSERMTYGVLKDVKWNTIKRFNNKEIMEENNINKMMHIKSYNMCSYVQDDDQEK